MQTKMKIGELARRTGFSTKAIRYYELLKLLPEPDRTESGYRLYGQKDVERLEFIEKAKHLGFSLEDIRDILILDEQQQRPCVHVLALLDQKLEQVDDVLRDLKVFRKELAGLRKESAEQIERLPADAICGIVERGVHAKGEAALAWLEFRQPGKRGGR
ncbi:MAG: heavy metal-responsive transcriptional regulator [Chloroflexi bacterium]|nr:heavy metal-responsive transcriptional regulator [Chloroflexota bacterium]